LPGNTGLGKETVLQLAKHHPTRIYLAARTASKAESAIADIRAAVPEAPITFLSLDLTSFASIQSAAETFQSKSDRLDILINNAGIMAVPAGATKEGYEIQFGTNHVGHALLTRLLLPTLLRTAEGPGGDVRILNLSSEGHHLAPTGGILFDRTKLDAQGTWARYGQSKLANILFTRSLAKKYPSITSVSLHPGVIKTDLYGPNKESNAVVRYGLALFGPLFMRDIPQGAKNQLWAATTETKELENGAYYKPVATKSGGSADARDANLAESLWEWTEKELASQGF